MKLHFSFTVRQQTKLLQLNIHSRVYFNAYLYFEGNSNVRFNRYMDLFFKLSANLIIMMKGFAEMHFELRGMNFLDATKPFPSELRWYGEALLKFRSIELWPVETLFRCYHCEQQSLDAKKTGESDETLSQIYLGVCSQSNWDKELDQGQNEKGLLSNIVRTIKLRILRRLV